MPLQRLSFSAMACRSLDHLRLAVAGHALLEGLGRRLANEGRRVEIGFAGTRLQMFCPSACSCLARAAMASVRDGCNEAARAESFMGMGTPLWCRSDLRILQCASALGHAVRGNTKAMGAPFWVLASDAPVALARFYSQV